MNETRDPDAAPGAPRVPGLRLLRLLGAGGQGEVWLADDLASGEQVAVKIGRDAATALGVPGSGPPGARSREPALLRRIDHPHVVRLRRVVDLPGGARALVLDHAEGGSIEARVRACGPLTAPEACAVVVPVARTLAELHGRGLVHGDLTASNVLLTRDGRPLIADLGCAQVLGGARPVEAWGSEGYLDPAAGDRPEPAADVHALGAVLRFALTGDPRAGGVPGLRDAGPEHDALLALADLCTAPDPRRRPGLRSVADLALAAVAPQPLRPFVPPPTSSQPPGPPGPPGPPDPADPAAPPGRGEGGGGEGRPVVVRIGPAVRRPPGSAAAAGWTRPPTPRGPAPGAVSPAGDEVLPGDVADQVSTAATGVPVTRHDLPVAVTRRRPVAPSAPSVGAAPGRRSGRRHRDRRRRGSSGRVRVLCGGVLACVGLGAGAWWWGARPPAVAGVPPFSAAADPSPAVAAGPPVPPAGREPIPAAVARLAEGRARAFRQVAEGPLALVDEPGSSALATDRALVGRLRAAGVRLQGLVFEISDVRAGAGRGGVVPVRVTVSASAHRQVPVDGSSAGAPVPAAAARTVVLSLVPAADGLHWLVRRVDDAPPGEGVSAAP